MGQLASGAFDGSGEGTFPGGSGIREVICIYDFDVHGGAVATHAIGHLPIGAVILGGYCYVDEALVGAGASVAIDSNAGNDIITAAAVAGAPWSTTGKKAITPKINTPESTSITMTAERDILANISAQPLTDGKFTLHLIVQNAL